MIHRTEQNRIWHLILVSIFCSVGISLQQTAIASNEIETSGTILQIFIPSVAFGTTFYLDDKDGRSQFYKSFFTNIAMTHGLKNVVDKKRPDGGHQSFPSGHASTAFQGAAFIHKRYGLKYGIPAYIGASFVGYSRVESDRHYTEDVIAGAAIGAISSFYFTKPYKGFLITPTANNGAYGISFSKKW